MPKKLNFQTSFQTTNTLLAPVVLLVTYLLSNSFKALPESMQEKDAAVNGIHWMLVSILESMKTIFGISMTVQSGDPLSKKVVSGLRVAMPPALCTTAAVCALLKTKVDGELVDAKFFAAGFLMDSVSKFVEAYEKYQRNENCKKEIVSGIATLSLFTGVLGICIKRPEMVVMTFLGAIINLVGRYMGNSSGFFVPRDECRSVSPLFFVGSNEGGAGGNDVDETTQKLLLDNKSTRETEINQRPEASSSSL